MGVWRTAARALCDAVAAGALAGALLAGASSGSLTAAVSIGAPRGWSTRRIVAARVAVPLAALLAFRLTRAKNTAYHGQVPPSARSALAELTASLATATPASAKTAPSAKGPLATRLRRIWLTAHQHAVYPRMFPTSATNVAYDTQHLSTHPSRPSSSFIGHGLILAAVWSVLASIDAPLWWKLIYSVCAASILFVNHQSRTEEHLSQD
jgi:hypothetical protein